MLPRVRGYKKIIFCVFLSALIMQGRADVFGENPVPAASAAAQKKTEAAPAAYKRPSLPAGVIPSATVIIPPQNQKIRIVEPLPKVARRITVLERVEPVVKTYSPAEPPVRVVETEKVSRT